jgi:superfamily II DNA/RNA helicase
VTSSSDDDDNQDQAFYEDRNVTDPDRLWSILRNVPLSSLALVFPEHKHQMEELHKRLEARQNSKFGDNYKAAHKSAKALIMILPVEDVVLRLGHKK